jgi:hypothetical protein
MGSFSDVSLISDGGSLCFWLFISACFTIIRCPFKTDPFSPAIAAAAEPA